MFTPPKDQVQTAAKPKLQKNEEFTEADYQDICVRALLSAEDVRIWVEHISFTTQRRKAGAKKAAVTKAKKIPI